MADGLPTVTKGFFLVTNTTGTITWLISLHGLALPLFTGKTDKKETGLQVSLLDEWLFLPKSEGLVRTVPQSSNPIPAAPGFTAG